MRQTFWVCQQELRNPFNDSKHLITKSSKYNNVIYSILPCETFRKPERRVSHRWGKWAVSEFPYMKDLRGSRMEEQRAPRTLGFVPSYRAQSPLSLHCVCARWGEPWWANKAKSFYLGGLFKEQGGKDYGYTCPNPVGLLRPHKYWEPQRYNNSQW